MVVVLLITALNVLSVRLTAWAQTALTGVPLVLLVVLAVWGLTGEAAAGTPSGDPTGLVGAWMAVYLTYAGWPAILWPARSGSPPAACPLVCWGALC